MKYIQKFTLKQYRVLADMTQEQLAEALDIDQSTLVAWESGKLPQTFKRIAKLEELFDIRVADDLLMPEV